jgi:hypothetical protein
MAGNHRRACSRALAFVALLLLMTAGALPAGAAGQGSISGRVVGAGDGTPISGICVSTDTGSSGVTGVDGTYVLTGLETGTYRVRFSDCSPQPRYRTQWYLQADRQESATPVEVTDGVDPPLDDVALDDGVVVSGTVTAGGAPLADASVDVNPTGSGVSTSAKTDADGHYATEPLPPGDYRVRFHDGFGAWATQYWNAKPSWNAADTLHLAETDIPSRAGIDADLTASAQIRGVVTGSDGSPVSGICVEADILDSGGWDRVDGTTTDSDGTYVIAALPAASYAVHFYDCPTGQHLDQWYEGASGPDTATSVVLAAGEDRSGVDAHLTDGVAVAGHVTDGTGAPLGGINVNVNPVDGGPSGWAQTDANGDYRTGGLAPGDYRVQFTAPGPDPAWATQYWQGQPTWNVAQILHLLATDGPTHGGIDASMTAAARISGVVTTTDGTGIGGICVGAIVDTSSGPDWAGGATTAADGGYTITGLPGIGTRVRFEDCNHVGPYVEQWWQNQPASSTATVIDLTPGGSASGVDATLLRAGAITGHVTDRSGQPLEGICAQASTDTQFGGLGRTDASGNYVISLSVPGVFRVQFVDCRDTTSFASQWWDDQPSAATANLLAVGPGQTVPGVDAHLDPGSPATISGNVSTLRGEIPSSACVVAYLPNQFARFAPVAPDGSYTIADVPSGTFALAALSCSGEEPSPVVPDPSVAGVSYAALWWEQVPLHFDQTGDGGPDPIAQHANLIAVAPGDALADRDFCFGCGAIALSEVVPAGQSVTLGFTTPGLVPPEVQAAADIPGAVFTATCTPSSGGISQSASGAGQTLTVGDLTAGATYACGVTASVDGLIVASSAPSASFTVPGPVGEAAPPPGSAEPASLAFTGGPIGVVSAVAAVMLLAGSFLALTARRRRARQS